MKLRDFGRSLPPMKPSKMPRTSFSNAQLAFLRTIFRFKTGLSSADREAIAARLNVRSRVVQVWFQNERQRRRAMALRYDDDDDATQMRKAASLLVAMSRSRS